jgi:hypothetical protein
LDKRIEDKKAMLGESNVLLKNAPDELPVLVSYYDEEIKRRTAILVECMLIAHGNMVQIAMKQIPEQSVPQTIHCPKERVNATCLQMAALCPDKLMSDSISILKPILQCSSPFSILLDMKSRHVPHIWALVVDYLSGIGVRVEGITSFFPEDIRGISQYCSSSVNEIVFEDVCNTHEYC